MNYEQVGSNILYFLHEKGWKQVDLARALGASKQVVNKIIKGTKALKTDELVSISRALEVSLDDIVSGTYSKPADELQAVHLYGKIQNRDTADFIIELISNLSVMEDELAAHKIAI